MANPNSPFGFIPVAHLNGGANFLTQSHALASGYGTAIHRGDSVKLVSGKIERCAATDVPEGIFQGVHYRDSNGEVQFRSYWPASTVTFGTVDAEAYVITDKQVVYEAQFTGTPSLASINSSFTIATTTGSDIGRSKEGVTTTTTNGHYKLIGFVKDAANEIGEFARGLFVLN